MRQLLKKTIGTSLLLAVVLLIQPVLFSYAATMLRLKDITRVKEVRHNQLIGYGLVVGLNDTGDNTQATQRAQQNFINNMGGRLDAISEIRGANTAQVVVTAMVPPFSKPGDRIDVLVSSLANAKSLEGGVLISTQLVAPNGEVVAVAQGPISTGGSSVSANGSSQRTSITTSARVPQGAIVEREIFTEIGDGSGMDLVLNRTDFTLASRISDTVSQQLAPARAVDGSTIRVQFPAKYVNNRVAFMAQLENLRVPVQSDIAKVVVNERTGTIVIGNAVRLLPAAVAHGGITVKVQTQNAVSQPGAFGQGTTTPTSNSELEISESTGALVELGPSATLNDLVTALNTIGVSPSDLISVLQALKAAGSLEAELEII